MQTNRDSLEKIKNVFVRSLGALSIPLQLAMRCDRLRLLRIWWLWKIWIEMLTNTLNGHTGTRNAIQGSSDCRLNEGTQNCWSQKSAFWRNHLLASYSSSTDFAQLLEHPIQTERLRETMNFNNEFAGTSYQHSQSASKWPQSTFIVTNWRLFPSWSPKQLHTWQVASIHLFFNLSNICYHASIGPFFVLERKMNCRLFSWRISWTTAALVCYKDV